MNDILKFHSFLLSIIIGIALMCIAVSGIIGTYRISEIENHISHPAKLRDKVQYVSIDKETWERMTQM